MGKELFFICGRGRSGTWLLQSMLNSHSNICMSPESLFIMDLHKTYEAVKGWNSSVKTSFLRDLLKDDKIRNWWLLEEEKINAYFQSQNISSFHEAVENVYAYYAALNEKEDATMLGDKNPEYLLFARQILKMLPNSKFIIMVRDPRANVSSFKRVNFDSSNSAVLAYRWNNYNRKIQALRKDFPENIIIIKFEDLIVNFQNTGKQICNFLNLEFEAELLTFYERPTKVFEWNKAITSPPDPSKLELWKSHLEKKEVMSIEHICKDLMYEFGYQKSTVQNVSFLHKIQLIPAHIVSILISFLEQNYFKLPKKLRHYLISKYRHFTNVIEKK